MRVRVSARVRGLGGRAACGGARRGPWRCGQQRRCKPRDRREVGGRREGWREGWREGCARQELREGVAWRERRGGRRWKHVRRWKDDRATTEGYTRTAAATAAAKAAAANAAAAADGVDVVRDVIDGGDEGLCVPG